jgi:predicted nucleic acid-binding protein
VILVDTSIWIDHLRSGNRRLRGLLDQGDVLCHPLIVGEVACGSLRHREEVLALLDQLPKAVVAEHAEVLEFLNLRRLYGKGIGWIDLHLLASVHLSNALLWTADSRVEKVAAELGCAARDNQV